MYSQIEYSFFNNICKTLEYSVSVVTPESSGMPENKIFAGGGSILYLKKDL